MFIVKKFLQHLRAIADELEESNDSKAILELDKTTLITRDYIVEIRRKTKQEDEE
tara:strand:- start:40083 stop:40247 length:165 start_codon:yes stop_codon:yes gene_type:complete